LLPHLRAEVVANLIFDDLGDIGDAHGVVCGRRDLCGLRGSGRLGTGNFGVALGLRDKLLRIFLCEDFAFNQAIDEVDRDVLRRSGGWRRQRCFGDRRGSNGERLVGKGGFGCGGDAAISRKHQRERAEKVLFLEHKRVVLQI
jgi:hypothetical protein